MQAKSYSQKFLERMMVEPPLKPLKRLDENTQQILNEEKECLKEMYTGGLDNYISNASTNLEAFLGSFRWATSKQNKNFDYPQPQTQNKDAAIKMYNETSKILDMLDQLQKDFVDFKKLNRKKSVY